MKEEKPRVTITADFFGELVRKSQGFDELSELGDELFEKAMVLMRHHARRGEAARRLVRIHRARDAMEKDVLRVERDKARDLAESYQLKWQMSTHRAFVTRLPWLSEVDKGTKEGGGTR